MRLSVLDQSPIAEGSTAADALGNSLDLARLAEELGYTRYWVAEHHGTPMLAAASPEILVAEIAARTERIRVGSGGVMLSHYSPFKVAEQFGILAGLHGGRIDLGVGRAPGADLETIYALQRDRREPLPDDFVAQVDELLAYFDGTFPPGHPFARLATSPRLARGLDARDVARDRHLGRRARAPLLGRGLRQPLLRFQRPALPRELPARPPLYSPRSRSGSASSAPRPARRPTTSPRAGRWRSRSPSAASSALCPEPERAQAFLRAEPQQGDGFAGRRVVVGPPGTVRTKLQQIAAEYGADELVVLTMTHDHGGRRRSYELLAEEFGLATLEE